MRKIFLIFMMALLMASQNAWADAATKLSRGVSNVAFGWFDIINEMGNEADQHGMWIGFPSGLLRGAYFGAVRTLAGAYEVVTFPLPNWKKGYDPVVLPESVFAHR